MTRQELLDRYATGERDFRSLQLPGIDLSGTTLRDVNLAGATLAQANLRNADLERADLTAAELPAAHLDGAILYRAELKNALLDSATLVGSNLSHANSERADFERADLRRADFRNSRLVGANLKLANLRGAGFEGADLSLAVVQDAKLDFARFDKKAAKTLRFDGNSIRGVQLPPNSGDPWSVLRRAYSGPRFALHLLTIILFGLPYASHALLWLSVNRMQQVVASVSTDLQEAGKRLTEKGQPEVAQALGKRLLAVSISPCLEHNCSRWKLWQLLVGFHRGTWITLLAILLIVYNGLRFVLTMRVGAARDEEERSKHAPRWDEYRKLRWLHWGVQTLAWTAWLSLVVRWYLWLDTDVWLPS